MSQRKRIVSQAEMLLSELARVARLPMLDDASRNELNRISDQLKVNVELQNVDGIESLLAEADQLISEKANDIMSEIRHRIDANFQEKLK